MLYLFTTNEGHRNSANPPNKLNMLHSEEHFTKSNFFPREGHCYIMPCKHVVYPSCTAVGAVMNDGGRPLGLPSFVSLAWDEGCVRPLFSSALVGVGGGVMERLGGNPGRSTVWATWCPPIKAHYSPQEDMAKLNLAEKGRLWTKDGKSKQT